MPQRIVIVDDQTLLREGFRNLLELEPDVEVVGTAGDGEEALAMVERLYAAGTAPDVILMDIRMPRMDGIAATKALKERWPDTHVIILTTFDDVELIHAGLHAGALGYLLKDATSEQLMTTIRAAAKGQALLQPEVARKVFAALSPDVAAGAQASAQARPVSSSSATGGLIEQLTEREREILVLVTRGASNRQIGEELFITEGTVKNHLSNILRKMGARDRTQAALKAKELGLV